MDVSLIIFSVILVIVVLLIIAVIQHNREEDRKEASRIANENIDHSIKRYVTDQRKATVSKVRRSQREGTEFITPNTRSAYDCDIDSVPSRQTSRSSHSYSDSGSCSSGSSSSSYSSSDSGGSSSSCD